MLDALRSIVQHVNDATNFREALDLIVREVRAAMGTEVCSVYLRNAENKFSFVANEGLNREVVGRLELGEDEGLVALVGKRAEPLNLQDATTHPQFLLLPQF